MRQIYTYPLLLAALLTVSLAGCRQEPLPEAENAIRFSVDADLELSSPTKATLVNTADDMQSGTILLYGSVTPSGSSTKQTLFDGSASSELSYTSGKWRYTPLRYWKKGGTHDFRAVYPKDANVQVQSESSSAAVSVVYTMSGTGVDMMVASAPAATVGSPVTLQFQHACAAVRFFFKDPNREEGSANATYNIKDFKLQYLYTTGTLNFNVASTAVIPFDNWGVSGDRTQNAYAATGSAWPVPRDYDTDSRTASTEWLVVVPQNLNKETITETTLSFTIVVTATNQEIPVSFNLETYPDTNSTPQDVIWNPGYQYSYYISIEPDAIGFSVEWNDWGEEDTNVYTYTGE